MTKTKEQYWKCDFCGELYHKNFRYKTIIDKETLKELKVCEDCVPNQTQQLNVERED